MSVTKAGLTGTDRRDGRGRTMGRGLSESRGSGSVRRSTEGGKAPMYSTQYAQEFRTSGRDVLREVTY